MKTKICSKCGIRKSLKAYHKNSNHGDGYRPECKRHRRIVERNRLVEIRLAVVSKIGVRCSSPSCRWLNEDGSLGCSDIRLLHIDHKRGGGNKERKIKGSKYYRRLLKLPIDKLLAKYQLLCPNCNWLKRLKSLLDNATEVC